MKIEQQYEIIFDIDETLIAATMSKPNEAVIVLSSGNVIRFNLDEKKREDLFSLKSSIGYSDGGFDITAKISIYTLDEIVVVVNDFKTHAIIHYPGKYMALRLQREDYYAEISQYPIALFKNEINIPHLIYAAAWNHIQIMNLDTRQILTASKSLIEENAEEEHIKFYKKHNEVNKLAWPRPYDYFFGKLKVSQNCKYFLSAGWVWGSFDAYTIYNMDHFIKSHRISSIRIGGWEHENRAVCWINNNTVAVTYNPLIEGDDNSNSDTPNEIHFYELNDEKTELVRKIKVGNLDIKNAEMEFSNKLNSLVVFSEKLGIALISLEGVVMYHSKDLKVNSYFADTDLFITTTDKAIFVNKLI